MRLALLVILLGSIARAQTPAPVQPIPFSHKTHAGTAKLPCRMCHPNPDPGDSMTIAPASTCMQCHSAIDADHPAIRKLAAYAQSNTPIPWVRVYQIPTYVSFSHRSHLKAGAACLTCHGPVSTRDALFREADISMGACMNCHRLKKVSIDCTFCHDDLQQ